MKAVLSNRLELGRNKVESSMKPQETRVIFK